MAGHPVFHDATVHFTAEFVDSLPKKILEYRDVIQSDFKLRLIEGENGGYALVGHVKYIAAFDERFPQYVRQEQKKAIESILSEGSKNGNSSENDNMAPMLCPICKFASTVVADFRKHIRNCKTSLNEEILKFLCNLCDQKHFETQNLSVYIRHLKTIHSKRKEVLCDQCGMSFNRQDALRSHKNAVHGNGVKKPYICELCEKAFRCNSHLITHYQKHDDTKNVECDHCSVKFKTEASRNKHVIYKHANPKPFKCDQCGRGFSTKQNLKTHLSIHEKEKETYDAEKEVLAISQQIAAHIQKQMEQKQNGEREEPMEMVDQHSSELVTTNMQSVSNKRPISPSEPEVLPTFTDQSPAVAVSDRILAQPTPEVAMPSTIMPSPVVYPSAPPSVSSQFTGYSTEQMSHHEADNHADLDEIFPEPPHQEEPPVEDAEPGYDSNQEELDSVFAATDQVGSETHTPQISRPPSAGSHHPDGVASRALDALLQLRPTLNSQEAAAVGSPAQSVCSGSQFPMSHQSRPPSVGSQHSSFHDSHHNSHVSDNTAANPALHYDVTNYMGQPEPEIFGQPMSCSSTMNASQIQSFDTIYNNTDTNTTAMYHNQGSVNTAGMYQPHIEGNHAEPIMNPPPYRPTERSNSELFSVNNQNSMYPHSSSNSIHHSSVMTNNDTNTSNNFNMAENTMTHDAAMFNHTNRAADSHVPSQSELTRMSMQTPVNPIASSSEVVLPIPQSVKYVTEQMDTDKPMDFSNLTNNASSYDPDSVSFTDTFATPHYTNTGNPECVVCESGRCLTPNTFAAANMPQSEQVSGIGRRDQGPSFASPMPHPGGIVPPDTLIIPDNAHLTSTELHTPNKNFPPSQSVVPDLPDSILDYSSTSGMNQSHSNNM